VSSEPPWRRLGVGGTPEAADGQAAVGGGAVGRGKAGAARLHGLVAAPSGANPGAGRAAAVGVYLTLLLFGAAQAVLGAFFFDSGPVPLAAIGFDVAIFGTCLLGGWGTRRSAGGLAPALGWFLTAFLLASGTSGGSVVITATAAGTWFLFGGAAATAAGLIVGFVLWSGSARADTRRSASQASSGRSIAPAQRDDSG
jgi:hypothetical protein